MTTPYIGEIKLFAGTFAPRGYALCEGQLLAISQNSALFSLLGTIYGGDGRTTFGLPDLRGRLPMHQGSGPGLSPRSLGQKPGAESVVLGAANLPPHGHALRAANVPAGSQDPTGLLPAAPAGSLYAPQAPDANLQAGAVGNAGGSSAHTNLMPAQCLNFIIALVGVYPSRS